MLDVKDVDAVLAREEALMANLRPGCEKQVIWADGPGVKTRYALLYIHGFSASGPELRPLPDMVAAPLDANIHFTRLTGHGQDGAAMATATFEAWQADVREALTVAHAIGERVIIMGCSTGCTLATFALAQGAVVHAVIHVSPNFGMRSPALQLLLDMPGARHWAPWVGGRTRRFEPINDQHSAYWTTEYPTRALFPMVDAVRAVRRADLSVIKTPAFFAVNPDDTVISPKAMADVIARWGGPVEEIRLKQTPEDDPHGHVMAGDVFSPGQTGALAARINGWLDGLAG